MYTDIQASSGIQPTTPVFERPKRVHALDRAATVIGYPLFMEHENSLPSSQESGINPYNEPVKATPHSHALLLSDPFQYYILLYA
jgi:hypothetical protein